MKGVFSTICLFVVLFVFQVLEVNGQVYPFTYQGSLKDGNVSANGNYDIKFDLYNVSTGGVSQGGANFLQVPVVNGIFSLEFGAGTTSFFVPGATYWVELSVRPSSSTGPHTLLTPRQKITYVPYSIASMVSGDALKLGGTLASQYVVTTDPRLSDERTPAAGSSNYIQNGTSAQAASNFNISGTGAANILNAATQYDLAGSRVLSSNIFNTSLGRGSGATLSGGEGNSYFGFNAGNMSTGTQNSFFGSFSGEKNTTGSFNQFFGYLIGSKNTTGSSNAFFGGGGENTTGSANAFFGELSGSKNTTGSNNIMAGYNAGLNNTTGSGNTFIGSVSANSNTLGNNNTAVGYFADVAPGITNGTALGLWAKVTQSNSLVLGSINGVNGATADTNVGIGTTAPANKLHVNGTIRVTNGAVYITNPNTVIITSPNGACWGITVGNTGVLSTFPVAPCP